MFRHLTVAAFTEELTGLHMATVRKVHVLADSGQAYPLDGIGPLDELDELGLFVRFPDGAVLMTGGTDLLWRECCMICALCPDVTLGAGDLQLAHMEIVIVGNGLLWTGGVQGGGKDGAQQAGGKEYEMCRQRASPFEIVEIRSGPHSRQRDYCGHELCDAVVWGTAPSRREA